MDSLSIGSYSLLINNVCKWEFKAILLAFECLFSIYRHFLARSLVSDASVNTVERVLMITIYNVFSLE